MYPQRWFNLQDWTKTLSNDSGCKPESAKKHKFSGSNGFCGQILHPRRDPATSMFWSQLEWYWNPFSASKGEACAPS
jgi:hypothetical protein